MTGTSITMDSNSVTIGSNVANANGQKSNIQMYAADGINLETQSSAFTETFKNNIAFASIFGGNRGKRTIIRNFQIMGQSGTTLAVNTTYNGGVNYNIGAQLNAIDPGLFNSSGKFTSPNDPKMNFSMYFELGFRCKNSTMRQFKSYIQIQDTNNVVIDNSYTQGIHYRTGQTFNEIIYYNVGPLKHIITTGHQIILSTTFDFTTGSEGNLTVMEAKFTIERNPL
jgi:hypothetical protein